MSHACLIRRHTHIHSAGPSEVLWGQNGLEGGYTGHVLLKINFENQKHRFLAERVLLSPASRLPPSPEARLSPSGALDTFCSSARNM